MDDDYEYNGAIAIGSGVIVDCGEKKYIGYFTGTDETYLYLKTTHRWAEVNPEVSAESVATLYKLLRKRPKALLLAQVAIKYRMIPLGMDKDEAVELLVQWISAEAVYRNGPVGTYLPEAQAVTMGVPHFSIETFESLADVVDGRVLAGLDFSVGEEYNGEDEQRTGNNETD